MKFLKLLVHFSTVLLLTVLTQIGGLLYLICILVFRKSKKYKYLYFVGIYVLCTLFIIPWVAPLGGRERIENSELMGPRNYFYVLANRNYVTPAMNLALQHVSQDLNRQHPELQLVYLDANFPFFDGFPLLPHLSHDDGKKVDLCFIYKKNGTISNKKPSLSGYGVYEGPQSGEWNQPTQCKQKGYWQYDFPKYLTFGVWDEDLAFDAPTTKQLLKSILKHPNTGKVFIEPHLRQRLSLAHRKLRYHGCQAVRHDDHIHFQIR